MWPTISATCSAPSRPFRASDSDSLGEPGDVDEGSGPLTVQYRLVRIATRCWSRRRETYEPTRSTTGSATESCVRGRTNPPCMAGGRRPTPRLKRFSRTMGHRRHVGADYTAGAKRRKPLTACILYRRRAGQREFSQNDGRRRDETSGEHCREGASAAAHALLSVQRLCRRRRRARGRRPSRPAATSRTRRSA